MSGEQELRLGDGTTDDVAPLAHLGEDGRAHLLIDHLRAVGSLARRFAEKIGSPVAGDLAGRWHDLGKYSGDFQAMIRRENGVEAHIEVENGPRDHSTAGALHAIERLGPQEGPALAFAIAGHHAGLANLDDLKRRLTTKKNLLEAVMKRGPALEIIDAPISGWRPSHLREPLDWELWIRLLFSALCDADFLDTEEFYRPDAPSRRQNATPLSDLLARLNRALDEKASTTTEVNRVRGEVRNACRSAGTLAPGIFSLSVPTGGGKTLASMSFALEHAVKWNLERVIVAIPFTSILEQNAAVYRDIFGAEHVVEHHSGLDPDRETHRNRIASENWDAPIVVTTTVQLFESLLASRPRQCRKLHNLTRAVIVLDEAQSLPGELLPVVLDVLARLARDYASSVVISTATQPALGKSTTIPEGFEKVKEICSPNLRLFDRLRRVNVSWPSANTITPYADVALAMAREQRALAIVHRRKDAADLCRSLDAALSDKSAYHLSALMTPFHRREVLQEVRRVLRAEMPVRLVATQLIEAGVDVDFPIVYRAFAGLDSLCQAAGRCNREGRNASPGELRVFFAETTPPPGILERAFAIARTMWMSDPSLDLFSPRVQSQFFARFYASTDLARGRDLQRKRAELQFRTVDRGDETARGFEMITNDWAAPLVVAHDARAVELVDRLRRDGPSRAMNRRLQQFVVNVPRRLLDQWKRSGTVQLVGESVHVLDEMLARHAYDSRFGLVLDRVGVADPSFLIF